ncbi:MAG: hypothetical protein Fur0010_09710 [Bdellovibrio sp.]
MHKSLLAVERMVFDSLIKCEKSMHELTRDTSLSSSMLRNILNSLIVKGMIEYKKGIYGPTKMSLNELDKEYDLLEMSQGLARLKWRENDDESFLTLKKIYVDKDDELILKSMMASMDSFVRDIQLRQSQNPKSHKVGERKVIVLGMGQYSRLVDASLKTVS